MAAIDSQSRAGRWLGLHSRPPVLPAPPRAASPRHGAAGAGLVRRTRRASLAMLLARGRRRCPVDVRDSFEVGSRHGVGKADGGMDRDPPRAATGCRTSDGGSLARRCKSFRLGLPPRRRCIRPVAVLSSDSPTGRDLPGALSQLPHPLTQGQTDIQIWRATEELQTARKTALVISHMTCASYMGACRISEKNHGISRH